MPDERDKGFELAKASGEELNARMQHGIIEALMRHKARGEPIVVLRDGDIVQLAPDQIQVSELGYDKSKLGPANPQAST